MTTIAYRNGFIAYDSRVSADGTIIFDDFDKCVVSRGVTFVFAGKNCEFAAFVDCWHGVKQDRELDVYALVCDGESLWYVTHVEEKGLLKLPISRDQVYAIGSGGFHALTAMDMGASARKAVELAMKRDVFTGGAIREVRIFSDL